MLEKNYLSEWQIWKINHGDTIFHVFIDEKGNNLTHNCVCEYIEELQAEIRRLNEFIKSIDKEATDFLKNL